MGSWLSRLLDCKTLLVQSIYMLLSGALCLQWWKGIASGVPSLCSADHLYWQRLDFTQLRRIMLVCAATGNSAAACALRLRFRGVIRARQEARVTAKLKVLSVGTQLLALFGKSATKTLLAGTCASKLNTNLFEELMAVSC